MAWFLPYDQELFFFLYKLQVDCLLFFRMQTPGRLNWDCLSVPILWGDFLKIVLLGTYFSGLFLLPISSKNGSSGHTLPSNNPTKCDENLSTTCCWVIMYTHTHTHTKTGETSTVLVWHSAMTTCSEIRSIFVRCFFPKLTNPNSGPLHTAIGLPLWAGTQPFSQTPFFPPLVTHLLVVVSTSATQLCLFKHSGVEINTKKFQVGYERSFLVVRDSFLTLKVLDQLLT